MVPATPTDDAAEAWFELRVGRVEDEERETRLRRPDDRSAEVGMRRSMLGAGEQVCSLMRFRVVRTISGRVDV